MSTSDQVAPLPPPPIFIVCVGRKGSGKSELAWSLWESWPGDRVMIDTTGDLGTDHPDPKTVDLDVPPPSVWPDHLKDADEDRLSLRYVPDHGAPDYREDMDRVVGLAYSRGDCLLLVEETGLVAPAGQVFPNTRRALHMGRHQRLSKIDTMPRTMGVDPLVLAQADVIYCFELPNPDDRRRLAASTGWDPKTVDEVIAGLGPHEYARFITGGVHELAVFPPIPLKKRRRRAQAHLEDTEPV